MCCGKGGINGQLSSLYRVLRIILVFFTTIFWILGIVLLAVGIYVHVDKEFKENVASQVPYVYTGASLLIVVGLFTFITGFLGCCGAYRKSQCMLFIYYLLLLFIFVLLMAAGLWALASKDKIKLRARKHLRKGVIAYHGTTDSDNEYQKFMDTVQKNFKCCGENGYTDYAIRGDPVPSSCGETTVVFNQRQGCYVAVRDVVVKNMSKIAALAITVAVLLTLGMIFTMALLCAIRVKRRDKRNNFQNNVDVHFVNND